MLHGRLLWFIFALAALVAAFHALATFYEWYWTYRVTDVPMHFSGGALVAVASVWLLRRLGFGERPALVLGAVAASALSWELFEAVFKIAGGAGYALDTAGDFLFGMLGGAAGYRLARLKALGGLGAPLQEA